MREFLLLAAITEVHSNQGQIWVVEIGEYILQVGFSVHRRS